MTRARWAIPLAVAFFLLVNGGQATAASCAFTGSGTDWHGGTNWSCGHPPTADDSAFIGAGDTVTVDAAAEAGALFHSAGTITFSGDSNLAVDSYTAGADGFSPFIEGAGSVTVSQAFTKTGDGSFFVQNSAAGFSPDLILNGAATLSEGSMCVARNNDSFPDQPSLQIKNAFTIADGVAASPFPCTSGPRIHVNAPNGHLIKTAAATTSISTGIDNDGAITVQAGELKLDGPSVPETSEGDYVATAGTTLEFANNISVGGTGRVGGAGTIDVRGLNLTMAAGSTLDPAVLNLQFIGYLDLNGTTPVELPVLNIDGGGFGATLDSTRPVTANELNITTGVIRGDFVLTVPSGGSFIKTTSGLFSISGDADLILNEDASLEGGSIGLDNPGDTDPDLFINETFTIADGAAASPFPSTSGPRIHVNAPNGHLIKAAAGTMSTGTGIDNDGMITVQAGELKLDGPTVPETSDGDYIATAGTTLEFANNISVGASGRVGGAGTVDVRGLNLTMAAGSTLDPAVLNLQFIGFLDLNGTTPVTLPVLNIDGGGFGATLDSTRPITANALSVTSGGIQNDFVLTVPSGGSFSKTTGGPFFVRNSGTQGSADLVLDTDASLDGGSICVATNDSSVTDTPNLHINQDFVIGAGADPLWYTCSSQSGVHVNGPSGTLSKQGTGTSSSNGAIEINGGSVTVASGQTLSFANDYSQTGGTTTVAAGGVLDANVPLTGGTLRGSGEVDGNVTNSSGTVAPGTSPGTLTVDGAYAQSAAGTLAIDVDGTAQGTGYDHLAVTGAATLNGTLAVVPGLGFDPALSDTFQFLTSDSRTGTFATLTGAALADCKHYTLDYPGAPDFGARLAVEQVSPCLAIDDVTAQEGNNGGTKAFDFTVSLDQPASPGGVSVDFATDDGTAIAPGDYATSSGTLSFAAGETTRPITVQVNRDNALEPNETFFVDLSSPSAGAAISDGEGQGTIQNDDAAPSVSIDDVSGPEGTGSGASPFQFTVALSSPAPAGGASVHVATANGTASSPSDYTAISTTVNFAEGETSKPVNVAVFRDSVPEADETFFVNLSAPSNAVILDAQGRGTIENDDLGPPEISIDDVTREEGNSGTTAFTFTVSLSHPVSGGAVSVAYKTVEGSASDPADYTGVLGEQLVFTAGQQQKQVTIDVNGDDQREAVETFFVDLSFPTNATIARGRGTGRIINDDDTEPEISVGDVTDVEGTGATRTMVFHPGTQIQAPAGGIEFDYTTVDGTAEAGSDYIAKSGHITIPEGQFGPEVRVEVVSDNRFEPDEAFFIRLSNASGAPISDGEAQGTIQDDDFGVSVGDVAKDEGDSGTKTFNFTVSLNRPANGTKQVDYDTADGKAKAPGDYGAKSGTVVFTQGQQTKQVPIQVKGDTTEEPNEIFTVKLSNASGATAIADNRGTGTIRDDDAPPRISVSGPGTMPEGDSGTTAFPFEVSLSRPAPAGGASVEFEAVEMDRGTSAERGTDFRTNAGRLNFAAGVEEKTVQVLIEGDGRFEQDERFRLRISDAARATIADAVGVATIENDDPPPPHATIHGVSAPEDTGPFRFTITLDRPAPPGGVGAVLKTDDQRGAIDSGAEADFNFAQRTIFFPAGVPEIEEGVGVVADSRFEPNENLGVFLTAPNRGLVFDDNFAIVTIENDDPPPPHVVSMQNISAPEDTGPFRFKITLDRPAPPGGVGAVLRTFERTAEDSGAGQDYGVVQRNISFPEGVQEIEQGVGVIADTRFEPDETFDVVLQAPNRGLVIDDGAAIVTIENDDPRPPPKRLRVEVAGPGTVSAPGISCGSDCTNQYADGTRLVLRPEPVRGGAVRDWSGCDRVQTDDTCVVEMDRDRIVRAAFER